MPISIRRVQIDDIIQMQNANLHCLPENYHMWFWMYHYLLSPQGAHVAVTSNKKVMGYVLSKTEDVPKNKKPVPAPEAGVTSVAVFSRYRKLGLATKLLSLTHKSDRDVFRCKAINLHVRETNRPAHILYQNTLGYKFVSCENKYYADGENAWALKYTFPE